MINLISFFCVEAVDIKSGYFLEINNIGQVLLTKGLIFIPEDCQLFKATAIQDDYLHPPMLQFSISWLNPYNEIS